MMLNAGNSLHQRIIGALPTREWQVDSHPLDNVWYISTQREGERSEPETVRFDVPIGAWPNTSSLDDVRHINDLITAKILVWYSLEPAPIGWLRTASSVPGFHRTNLNFLRWKTHIGVQSNMELTAAHHRDFADRFRAKGLESLLDVEERARRLVEAARAGLIQLPRKKGVFFHAGIERLLGLTINQTPPEAIAVLLDYAREQNVLFQRGSRKRVGPQPRNTTKTAAFAQLSVWQTLWSFNEYLVHDPLQYDAYTDRGELQHIYGGWAEDGRKTPDAPPYQVSWLIDASLRFIFDTVVDDIFAFCQDRAAGTEDNESPYLPRVRDRIDALGFNPIAGIYRRSRWQGVSRELPTMREVTFRLLATAAVIVVAAFGARRDCELRALRPGCIQEDEFGDLWLHCWIAKNRRELTKIPANRVVGHAVSILERIGHFSAKYGDPAWLLEYFDPYGPVDFKFNEGLQQFSSWVNVPVLPDGNVWEFASHQFRKFFAVSFQWRYFFPDFGALNHHLRQSIDVTAGYAKMRGAATLRQYDITQARKKAQDARWIEMDRADALREVEEAFIVELLRGVVQQGETLGGAKGRAISAQLQEKFSNQIVIGSTAEAEGFLNRELAKLADQLHMRPHPEGHGLCGCGPEAKNDAVSGIRHDRVAGNRAFPHTQLLKMDG